MSTHSLFFYKEKFRALYNNIFLKNFIEVNVSCSRDIFELSTDTVIP